MTTETTSHFYICEIAKTPKKLQPLVAWRLMKRGKIIMNLLYKVVHGEI